MSEFECGQGHLMKSGEHVCKLCGSRLATMDGMTNRQLAAQERAEDAAEQAEQGNNDNQDNGGNDVN